MRIAIMTVCAVAGTVFGQASRDIAVTDDAGLRIEREFGAAAALDTGGAMQRAGVLWMYSDANSITQSVALGGGGGESWVAHSLNEKRMSKFTTTGSGIPDFVYSMADENPGTIGVAAAADASMCAVISWPNGGVIKVRGFSDTGGDTPLWTFTYNGTYTNSAARAVAVNADGSRIAACAYDGSDTLLVLLDNTGFMLGSATISGYCLGVEMDDSGTRILVTAGNTARLFDTSTMTEVYSVTTSGGGGYHRISRDGTAIAAGGFNIRAAREIAGVWQQVYAGSGSSDWFGGAMSLSGDGETLFVLAHNYGDGYLTNEHRIVDLVTGTEVIRSSYTGSGSLQNSAVAARVNQDGTIFACASWGDQGNTQPEVRIFDRGLNMIGSIDTPGSPFELDMSRDGQYVLVGSKAVHANTSGRGGRTYAYENEVGCTADLNGDGLVNTQDFLVFLNAWSAGDDLADWNGDGTVNTQDFLAYLNDWAAGC
jgi:hypothetical protein